MVLSALIVLVLATFANAAPVEQKWYSHKIEERNNDCYEVSTVDAELGDHFEGDILLTPTQKLAIESSHDTNGRNGIKDSTKRWPNGTVVYHIVEDDFNDTQVRMIEEGMADIANKSCIKFRPRVEDEHAVIIQMLIFQPSSLRLDWYHSLVQYYALIGLRWELCNDFKRFQFPIILSTNAKQRSLGPTQSSVFSAAYGSCIGSFRIRLGSENGCFSNVGLNNKDEEDDEEVRQVLNLAKGCFKHGTVVHEMLHTLGFYHMQSTNDRDEFVKIVWENIRSGVEYNFKKYTVDTVTDFGVPYDYGSVMHYSALAFSKNGNKTIIPLQENVEIGQRKGLSERDILKLNKMYNCQEFRAVSINEM